MPIISNSIVKGERGQTLVVVLLMLVIAVIVATAISYRTIQDINRAGEERLSAKAGAQVESFLDLFSEDENWETVWNEDCAGVNVDEVCVLDSMTVRTFLGVTDPDEFECEDSTEQVLLRQLSEVEGFTVTKDDVFEVPLDGDSSNGTFNVSWTGAAEYILVKVYTATDIDSGVGGEHVYALTYNGSHTWDNVQLESAGSSFTINYSSDAVLARIKPIGGDAKLSISGDNLPPLVAHIKASCYMDDVYREYVREFELYSSVPSVFDYVLFDGSSPDGITK